jgi:AmmeMemoRadiSam system protein A
MLSQEQRRWLLRIARHSIEAVLEGERPRIDPSSLDEALTRPSGAFVSLHTKDGDLRGCIGSIQPVAPLCEAVRSSAINAAFRDPRFFPVVREELPDLHIEISVMSPIEPVASVDDIIVGRDGLIVSRGGRAGLLLPQVATEYGWDRDAFLRHTCVKAGLPPDAWRSPECRIERFSAEVFSEQLAEK